MWLCLLPAEIAVLEVEIERMVLEGTNLPDTVADFVNILEESMVKVWKGTRAGVCSLDRIEGKEGCSSSAMLATVAPASASHGKAQ